ncbi:MAG: hypothetical protein U0Y68_24285 [Blastocatellia bacterium]
MPLPGLLNVTVVTPAPGGGQSASATFDIIILTLALTSLTPGGAESGDDAFTLTLTEEAVSYQSQYLR